MGDPPKIIDGWPDKPLEIKKVNGKEILYIVLYSRVHETNKWRNEVVAFYDSTPTVKTTITETYNVIANKSYFYDFPRGETKRNAYVQKGDEVEAILQENEQTEWINAKFINASVKVTTGFLKAFTLKRK